MSVRITKTRKGTAIHATGKDAQAFFDAMKQSITSLEEKTTPPEKPAPPSAEGGEG